MDDTQILRNHLAYFVKSLGDLKNSAISLYQSYDGYVSEWKAAINGVSLHKTALLEPLLLEFKKIPDNERLFKHLNKLLENPPVSMRFIQPNAYARELLKGAKEKGSNFYHLFDAKRYSNRFFGKTEYKVDGRASFHVISPSLKDSIYLKINGLHDSLMN